MVTAYCTVEEADDYFSTRLYSDSWTNAARTEKAAALTHATRTIDRLLLKGRKTDSTQSLAFPRYPDTEIPAVVKHACCEEALALLEHGNSQRRKLQQQGIQSFSIGHLSETYVASAGKGLLSQEAKEYLRPWLAGSVVIQ